MSHCLTVYENPDKSGLSEIHENIRIFPREYAECSSGFPNKPDSIWDLTILYHHVRVQFEFGLIASGACS